VLFRSNGYEVCEAIKASPATSRIPVVLLSGTFEPFDRDRAERLGCDAIVSKPFDSQQLLRQVEALLSRPQDDIAPAHTVAIPVMTNPAPPPAPAEERRPTEAGFSSEDFTGRIRRPAGVAGGADMFEEEYGQADVESAIAAFEKAHPEFAYVEDGAAEAAMNPDHDEDYAGEPEAPSQALAEWVHEEAPRPTAATPPPVPAPFWIPREPEPELAPIPFAHDDSTNRRRGQSAAPAARSDDETTAQIPLAAEFASINGRETDMRERDRDRITDETPVVSAAPEPPAELEPAPEPAATAAASAAASPAEEAPVSREIEVLAQTTSIGQLKEMLSSVSRGEGALSDDEIDRLASRVVERLSEKIVREIAWEVIPDVAEVVIKQRIKELEAGVE